MPGNLIVYYTPDIILNPFELLLRNEGISLRKLDMPDFFMVLAGQVCVKTSLSRQGNYTHRICVL